MKNNRLIVLLVFFILFSTQAIARKNEAQKARAQNLLAVTVFVDITALTRKNMAAKKMTKLHQQFADQGYELLSINTYTENGDLEGFFVSYKTK